MGIFGKSPSGQFKEFVHGAAPEEFIRFIKHPKTKNRNKAIV
jgi:hypothetical protein